MLPRLNTASWLVRGILLAAATLPTVGPALGDEGKSAREDADDHTKPRKVEARKGGDRTSDAQAERMEALERENQFMKALLKQQMANAQKQVDGHDADAKPGQKGKGDAKHGADGHHAKARVGPKEDTGHGRGGRPQLVKGKDGQLLVPLSALPPGIQKQFLARAREDGHGKAAEAKKGGRDDNDVDDDRPQNKKKGDGGDSDDRKPQKKG